jgi:hypothetical protein
VTAVVVETHDEWQVAERRDLSETSIAQHRRNEKAAIAEGPAEASGSSRPLAAEVVSLLGWPSSSPNSMSTRSGGGAVAASRPS